MLEIQLQPLGTSEQGGKTGKITVAHFPFGIGRMRGSDLRISDACISRYHCRLFERAGMAWVQDLGSMNGTFVNEERVRRPRPLRDRDVLRVAFVVFKVHAPVPEDDRTICQPDLEEVREGGRQVLVVEDDENAAETLALLLKTWGHNVRVAHDAREALEAARDLPPDTVLLDVRLPGMDGYQVARQLREEGLAGAQMVAMTGCPEEAAPPNAGDAGVQKVLIKPVEPDELRDVMADA
jgi:CheY-like chemotaxis protein